MKYKKIFSKKFQKDISKVKSKELVNVFKKNEEILTCENIDRYKNLRGNLKQYKRVHLNKSLFVLLQKALFLNLKSTSIIKI